MSVVGAPAPLVPGRPVALSSGQPAPGLGQVLGVVLQNLSSYLLAVTIGARAYSVAPWTADAFPLDSSGAGVAVAPATLGTLDPPGVPVVVPTWLTTAADADELAGAYPAALPISPATTAALVGGAVPVPPSAAAIGAAVPTPPSAAAIGTAVGQAVPTPPVPPTAAAIGAAVGSSVPIPPGAAAIGSATASSVAATGVPILQSSSPVLAGVLTQPPPGNISASLDCSQYDALNIGFQDQASTGTAGDVISANILWYSSTGSLLSTQTVGIVRIANGVQDQIEVQMPVLGPQCRIQNGSVLNTGTLGYVAVFQTCAGVPSPRIAGQAVGLDDRVIIQCPANVPASGTISVYGRAVSGRLRMIFLGTGAASNTVFASLFGYFGGKGWQQIYPRQQNLVTGSANNGQQSWDFSVPFGVPLRLDVQNNGASAVSPNVQIFDISDV